MTAWKRSWRWKVLVFLCLVFTKEFFVDFTTRYINSNYTSFKSSTCVYIMSHVYLLHRFWKICFWHFWKLSLSVEFCSRILSWRQQISKYFVEAYICFFFMLFFRLITLSRHYGHWNSPTLLSLHQTKIVKGCSVL